MNTPCLHKLRYFPLEIYRNEFISICFLCYFFRIWWRPRFRVSEDVHNYYVIDQSTGYYRDIAKFEERRFAYIYWMWLMCTRVGWKKTRHELYKNGSKAYLSGFDIAQTTFLLVNIPSSIFEVISGFLKKALEEKK